MLPSLSKGLDRVQKVCLRLFIPVDDRLSRVLRKLLVFYDELMQVVSKEVGAGVASVSVEDSEETALGPVFYVFLRGRLHDVKDDADSILVVVSNNTLVGVGCV